MAKKQFYSEAPTGRLSEWASAMAQICEEKGIPQESMVEVIESALSAAYKKETGRKGRIVRTEFNGEKGISTFWEIYRVIKKDEREWPENDPEKAIEKGVLDKKRKPKKWKEDFEERKDKDDKKPYFRAEREMLLEDAKKFYSKAKVGEYIGIPVNAPEDFGRIAAQTAKQVILQKIKETEREVILKEYSEKVGEVLPVTIQRIEGVQVYVDLGKTVALLPRREQVIGERYEQGQRIKVYILRVDPESRSTMVIVSRSHPGLLESLFSLEVPEIFSGTVEIVKVVREAGQRAKVAVKSKEEGIDPVGSCIGQRGTRVQAVTDELRGERIDIVEYDEDPIVFLERSLAPAKVKRVEIADEENKHAKVIVEKDQQSIAIGRNGQNVRLASRLAEWEIDIELDKEVKDKEEKPEKEEKKKPAKKEKDKPADKKKPKVKKEAKKPKEKKGSKKKPAKKKVEKKKTEKKEKK